MTPRKIIPAAVGFICLICLLLLPVNWISKSFALAAVANWIFFTYYFENFYNPASIFMSLFLFMIGCSQAHLTVIEQDNFAPQTWITLIVTIGVFYAVTFSFIRRLGRIKLNPLMKKSYTISAPTIFWSNIVCVISELFIYAYAINKIGSIPLFDDYVRANIMPLVINNYLMTLMILPTFFIIFNTIYVTQYKKYGYLFFSAIYLFLLMLLGGRINIFIPVITSLFYNLTQYYVTKENKASIIIITTITLAMVIALMVAMPLIRTQVYVANQSSLNHANAKTGAKYYDIIYNTPAGSEAQKLAAIKKYQATVKLKLPSQLLPVWVHLSTEMYAFNKMVTYLGKSHDFRHGRMLLSGTFRFMSKFFIPEQKLDLDAMGGLSWVNIITFMQKPYMDFGVYGVAGFMLFFSLTGMLLYQQMQQRKSMTNTLLYSYFCMTTLYMVFDNHFYSSALLVNIALLLLFKEFISIDWLAKLRFFKANSPIKTLAYD